MKFHGIPVVVALVTPLIQWERNIKDGKICLPLIIYFCRSNKAPGRTVLAAIAYSQGRYAYTILDGRLTN